MSDSALVLAGRAIPDAGDRIRRFCGLAWSGGPPETWAYRYYDAVPTDDSDRISPVDVLSAAALHPGLSRIDLGYFVEQADRLAHWLSRIPREVDLADADDELLDRLGEVSAWDEPVGLALRTKVLHRKRPRLLPLFDRAVVDWYRPVTGQRAAATAWAPLLVALREDLASPANQAAITEICGSVRSALDGPLPTSLRLADIAIWMGARP